MATPKTSTSRSRSCDCGTSISSLTERLTRTESDFVGHLQKVEQKLDQIVDLTRTVAVLQEQTARHADATAEARAQIREQGAKTDTSITRLHARIDELKDTHQKQLDTLKEQVFEKLNNAFNKAESVDDELKKWLNRGWGVWALAGVLATVSGGMFYRWVDAIDRERNSNSEVVERLKTESVSTKQQLELLTKMARDSSESSKRIEQRLSDGERQMDMLMNQVKTMQQPQQPQPYGGYGGRR